jgi:hypothetical protein
MDSARRLSIIYDKQKFNFIANIFYHIFAIKIVFCCLLPVYFERGYGG